MEYWIYEPEAFDAEYTELTDLLNAPVEDMTIPTE
jgi:hypothetical protein